jgi:hypothetical protein
MRLTLPSFSFLKCPENNISAFVMLVCFSIALSLFLIANPGFYNHDELKQIDNILQKGLGQYLKTHVSLTAGSDFAFAVRPVAYLVEGIASFYLHKYPFLMHLLDVLMHGTVACLLFVTTLRLGGNRNLAWAGALIFLINPLVTYSVGWSGALMDRLYILFGLIALFAAHKYISGKSGNFMLVCVFVASSFAMLSKETAIILPATLLIIYYFFGAFPENRNRLWLAMGAWSMPVILLILYRFEALVGSFAGNAAAPTYSAGLANIPMGLCTYFVYPFVPFFTEAHTWSLHSAASIGIAVACHLGLLSFLWRIFSFRVLVAYLIGYTLFLLPVLFLPFPCSHYLYGSGIAFSLALGALLIFNPERSGIFSTIFSIALLLLSLFHALYNHYYLYQIGVCMNRLSTTMESAYLSEGKPDSMTFFAEPGAPAHVLARFVHNRNRIGNHFGVQLQMAEWEKRGETKTGYIFNQDCLICKPEPFKLKINSWGPNSTQATVNPNPQANGLVGFWVEAEAPPGVGDLQVLANGQPAVEVSVQPKIITATFPPEMIAQPGKMEIAIKQVSSGQIIPVGTFIVEPKKSD